MIDREKLTAQTAMPEREVEIPSLGDTIRVRGMSSAERDAYEESMISVRGKRAEVKMALARARLLVVCLLNPDGSQMFLPGDVKLIGDLPAALVEPAYEAAQELSGMTEEDIEDLAKN